MTSRVEGLGRTKEWRREDANEEQQHVSRAEAFWEVGLRFSSNHIGHLNNLMHLHKSCD